MSVEPVVEPIVVSIVGASGSGKTTLIERLIPTLTARGMTVATVKHASHGFQVDREGSDSWRHHEAGAAQVLLVGPQGAVLFIDAHRTHLHPGADPHESITRLVREFHVGLDVVLAEGFAPICDLMIEVERSDVQRKPVDRTSPAAWITVTDRPDGQHRLSFDAAEEIARRISEYLDRS